MNNTNDASLAVFSSACFNSGVSRRFLPKARINAPKAPIAPPSVGVATPKKIVPSTKKVAGPGATLDIPLTHINASYVRSHFDAMEARISDAPRSNEILVAVVVTDSGRPHPRVGGLQVHEIVGKDGLR